MVFVYLKFLKMFSLRDYQIETSIKGLEILKNFKILILNFEVRTGKTHIALDIAKNYKNVLFVTKKKAISSIERDYLEANHNFNITIINYESLHKINGNYDLVIADESHSLSAFPKPSKRTIELKKFVKNDLILMSGTLLPESNAQIYHQLWISQNSPFSNSNFYKWHKEFGTPKIKYTSYGTAKDYSEVNYDKIKRFIIPLMLTKTQKESGFENEITEKILYVDMLPVTYYLANKLKKDLVINGKEEVILAETGVKLMQKLHQLYSGTVKFESGNSTIIDDSKGVFIKENFKNKKLAIFYKFKEELNVIKKHLDITQELSEFNTTNKHIALHILSGREGINLSKADYIVYFNIDFSATSYWQSRDRMTTINSKKSTVYWLFSRGGLEQKIYKTVLNKKDYTLQTFKKNERATISKKIN